MKKSYISFFPWKSFRITFYEFIASNACHSTNCILSTEHPLPILEKLLDNYLHRQDLTFSLLEKENPIFLSLFPFTMLVIL